MKVLKYIAGLMAGSLSLSLLGGCSSQNSGTLTETTVIMSETVEETGQDSGDETTEIGLLNGNYDDDDLNESWSGEKASMIKCNGASSEISGDGIQADGNILKITQAGTFVFSGTMDDGQIQVDADKEAVVHIVLNGLTASSSSSSVIYGIQSKKIVITLAQGQENTLSDAASYVYEGGAEDEPNACIFSKDDLSINGKGTLNINGNYQDGLRSKDNLKIINGVINVAARQNGVKGKDSVSIKDGDLTIDAGGDGIKSNNDTETDKGYVLLDGGKYRITAAQDGIQAETILEINGGSGSIMSGGGSSNASYDESGQPREAWGQWGGRTDDKTQMSAEPSESAKGLKAGTAMYLNGGDFTIDSSDDSIHSNGNITINDGAFVMESGDDGVHADNEIVINGGVVQVNKSYEGLEGLTVDIRGGDIDIAAVDDGINSAGGSDTMMSGRPGEGSFASGSDCWIRISGGDIYVKASGDGLDSNGNLYMDGGMVVVEGPEDSANGTLDYEGRAEITGGTFVGTGSGGMAMAFSDSSSQYSLNVISDEVISAGMFVTLSDSSGKEILSVSPTKSFECIQISSPLLVSGETYLITYGEDTSMEVTLDSISTWSGKASMGDGKGGLDGPGNDQKTIGLRLH